MVVEASCYTNTIAQTDSSPDITASGWKIEKGDKIIAANFLPFETKVIIGEDVYTVRDRMNPRYTGRNIDILFDDYDECIEFGRRNIKIKTFNIK